jgi:hypothetical protein
MRALAAIAIVFLSAQRAWAHPPPEPIEIATERPAIEWSSWFRLAYGYTNPAPEATPLASTSVGMQPAPASPDAWGWHAALGGDITLGVASDGDVRIGPWAELRGFDRAGVVAGGELVIERAPHSLDMFLYDGQGVLIVKAGGNDRVMTGAVAWGYLAPWSLFDPPTGRKRYMIGVRLVATATRAVDDPRDWSVTAGLEVEPIGALRYLLGIKGWY